MPTIVASSQRRASGNQRQGGRGASSSSSSNGSRVKQQQRASSSSSNSSAAPPLPILRTHSPSSPPVKSILIVNSSSSSDRIDDNIDKHNKAEGQATDDGKDKDNNGHDDTHHTTTTTNPNTSPSSYLKPLLKYLPRHIDPSTIARLLKNVHPSAFGSYRTKEAWRREHPEVLNTAHHILRQEQAEAGGLLDIESSHAGVLRPSTSSDEVCLAHSPPSATFSSSEDDDFDEEFTLLAEEEQEEFERREAKELEEYFNEEFDEGLSSPSSPGGSISSFRDSSPSNMDSKHQRRNRASSQDSITTAKNDNPTSSTSSTAGFLADLAATTLSSPKSPLAIYLSKPDEEQDSPLAGPSQRVIDLQNEYSSTFSSSSSPERSNDSSITVVPSVKQHRQSSPIASTSAAILYPRDEVNLASSSTTNRPRTPPSPSSSSVSPCASPSLLHSPSSYSSTSRRPHSPSSPSSSTSISVSQQSQPNLQYQSTTTISIPRIVRRSTSQSSLASSSNCTCKSNQSNYSNTSRSSSITFAPLPEEELKKARLESLSRGGRSSSAKSKVMGIKGRRNLLLGLNGDEDDQDGSGSPSSKKLTGSSGHHRRNISDDSSDDDDDGLGSSSSSSSSLRNRRNRTTNDQFDAIAYFGEEDLFNPPGSPCPSVQASSSSLTRDNTIKKRDGLKGNITPVLEDEKDKFRRKSADVTIHYGRNGELIERRPLGVTLEELTLPMKRVKETRGRSRITNDLSASFTSPKTYSSTSGKFVSPPMSPPIPSSGSSSSTTTSNNSTPSSMRGNGITSPPISPSRSTRSASAFHHDKANSGEMMIGSPESGNEKTPMPTPRLEKKELFMTTSSSSSNTVKYSNSGTMPVQSLPSSSSRDSLSPTSRIVMDHASLSGTSPTGSAHSNGTSSGGGSNDITPMPTPRAGSPIAGLKMTSLTKSQQPSSSSSTTTNTFSNQLPPKMDQEFQLMDSASFTLNTSSRGIRKMKTQEDQESKQEVQSITVDNEEVDHAILKVTPVVNILALGGLLEDTLSPPLNHPGDSATSPASSVGSTVPSLSVATGSSPEPDNSSADDQYQSEVFARSSREYKSDKLSVRNNDTGAKVQLETVVTATETHDDNDVIVEEEEEEDECDGDGIEEDSKADFDKTPTLHASMELPKLNDTTNHTLHARYRKKRTVGIPHVTAKKRALPTSSKKSRKP